MKSKPGLWRTIGGAAAAGLLALAGCESDGGGHLGDGHDFGPNNPDLLVAFGDSITAGSGLADPGSEAYSVKLAGMLGKTVVNRGYPGASSYEGLDRIYSILDDTRPGFLLILFGVNDLIMGYGEEAAADNLRIMIQACRDNKTIPVVATLTPVFGSYRALSSGVRRLNDSINQLCSDLDVPRVDLSGAFEDNPVYLLEDGLHPNDAGHTLMAVTFHDVVK